MQSENILIQAGLSEEQALVYEALLEKGPQKASPLSSWTGIKRSLIYKILEQLETMGLVEKKGGPGTVAVFSPLHPSLLMHDLERKEKELALAKDMLTHSLGTLSSKYNLIAGKPNVQFYEGKEAIAQVTNEFPKNEKEIRQFINIGRAMEQFPDETVGHLHQRIKAGISKRMIVPDTEPNRAYVKKGSELTEFRFIKNVLPTAVQIYDDKVSMLTLTPEKVVGLVIEDSAISETFKMLFDEYWERVAKPL